MASLEHLLLSGCRRLVVVLVRVYLGCLGSGFRVLGVGFPRPKPDSLSPTLRIFCYLYFRPLGFCYGFMGVCITFLGSAINLINRPLSRFEGSKGQVQQSSDCAANNEASSLPAGPHPEHWCALDCLCMSTKSNPEPAWYAGTFLGSMVWIWGLVTLVHLACLPRVFSCWSYGHDLYLP